MPVTYTPLASDALLDAFVKHLFDDPVDYSSPSNVRVDAKTFLKPIQDELMALIDQNVSADWPYKYVFECSSGLAVGEPVYVSAADTVTKADATTLAKSQVIGFVRSKPSTTTCIIGHFYLSSVLSGAPSAGQPLYLIDSGTWSGTPGTVTRKIGVFVGGDAEAALLFVSPVDVQPTIAAHATNAGALTISTATLTTVTFDSERYDTASIHSTSSNTGRLTAPVAGLYRIGGSVCMDPAASGQHGFYIYVNGSTAIAQTVRAAHATVPTQETLNVEYKLSAGDYVTFAVYQNSGGDLNIQKNTANSPEFWLSYVGPA